MEIICPLKWLHRLFNNCLYIFLYFELLCYIAAGFYHHFSLSAFQHCTLLHLCLVQQHRDWWAASPAGGAGHQHQLQRDRARGTRRPTRQNRSQRLLGTCRGHRRLLSGYLWQLGRVHDHGRQTESSLSCPNRPGVRDCWGALIMAAVLFLSTGWQHGSFNPDLTLAAFCWQQIWELPLLTVITGFLQLLRCLLSCADLIT